MAIRDRARPAAAFVVATAILTIPAHASVAIRLVLRNAAAPPSAGVLVLRSHHDAANVKRVPLVYPVTTLDEPAGTTWDVAMEAPGWWSSPAMVTFSGKALPAELALWRTGIVRGRMTAGEKGLVLPTALRITVESPPQPSGALPIAHGTSFDCQVTGDAWSCPVPATALDLVVRPKGMTPHYRWDLRVNVLRPVDLGELVLRRGASLVAWLDTATRKSLEGPATGRLVRPLPPDASQTTARLGVPVAEATFSDRGMLQLAPVPPGLYVLEVRAKGFAPARVGPMEVYEGNESTYRKAITLFPPLNVHVVIAPPLDPSGGFWQITWERNSDFNAGPDPAPRVLQRTGSDGETAIPDQAPGTYSLTVRDTTGNDLAARTIRLDDDADARIAVDINLVRVRGKVTLGDDPIPATLWFGGSDGAERVRFSANSMGRFEGYVPRRGIWPVEIVNIAPAVRSFVDVSVDKTDRDLAIVVPDTEVSGWVVGSGGERVSRGSVMVSTRTQTFTTVIRPDGTFRFRGLPTGGVDIKARDLRTSEFSRSLRVSLSEGERRENVELDIEPSAEMIGRVTSGGTPAVGARITAFGLGIGPTEVLHTVTDVTGAFDLRLNAAARRVLVGVAAPGRTLQTFEITRSADPVRLDIAGFGGTLDIASPGPFQLTRDNVSVPYDQLLDWLGAHGDPIDDLSHLHIPHLAPGHYRACDRGRCAEGDLAPGAALQLQVP